MANPAYIVRYLTRIYVILLFFFFGMGVLAIVPGDIFPFSVYLLDIWVLILLPYALVILLTKNFYYPFFSWQVWGFITICIFILSLLLSPIDLSPNETLLSSLYLLRLGGYAALYPVLRNWMKKGYISTNFIYLCMFLSIIWIISAGWIQYFLYPNIRNVIYLGWDPHLGRMVSTLLDPNYLGILLLLAGILIVFISLRRIWKITGIISLLLTLLFTDSRSSFFTMLILFLYWVIRYHTWKKIFLISFLFSIGLILIPRPQGQGGDIFRVYSIISRYESWKEGLSLVKKYPLFGVGYNTLRVVHNDSVSHASGGIDNSVLYVGATTGLVGLLSFSIFVFLLFNRSPPVVRLSLVAITFHSLFQNTLVYPWIMMWMWILISVSAHQTQGE